MGYISPSVNFRAPHDTRIKKSNFTGFRYSVEPMRFKEVVRASCISITLRDKNRGSIGDTHEFSPVLNYHIIVAEKRLRYPEKNHV